VQTYDILMAIVLIGAMLYGALKGFAWQLASIASIVVSYAVAYHYREPFSQNIQADPPWNRFLAMLILYVGTSFLIWIAFRMIAGTIDRMKLKEFDRQIGALFGLGKGAILCTLITLFAVTLLGERSQQAIIASRSGRWIARLLDQSDAIMPEELASVVRPYLDQFDSDFQPVSAPTPWFSEAPPIEPSTQFPVWQNQPNPAWSANQNSAPNWNQNPGQNLAPPPQWQQAAQTPPWRK
jgi:membrane protein required for colicin V production